MVSEHMLTVGRDPRNWQAHRKDFLKKTFLFKKIFYLSSFPSLIQIFPFSETIPSFLLDHSKIRRMRPLQEVQDIGQLRPFWNEEDFIVHNDNGKLQRLKTPKTGRIWRLWRIARCVWPRKVTLMELGRLWKPSMPEIKVYRRKTETWRVRNSKFC